MYCAVVSLAMLLRPLCNRGDKRTIPTVACMPRIILLMHATFHNDGAPALLLPDWSISILALKKVSFTVSCPFCGFLPVATVYVLHTRSVPVELETTIECSFSRREECIQTQKCLF
jgi:hypothetical protein